MKTTPLLLLLLFIAATARSQVPFTNRVVRTLPPLGTNTLRPLTNNPPPLTNNPGAFTNRESALRERIRALLNTNAAPRTSPGPLPMAEVPLPGPNVIVNPATNIIVQPGPATQPQSTQAFPAFPSPGGANPGGIATFEATVRTNRAGEKAEISWTAPALPIEQALDIYSGLIGRTLLRSSQGSPGALNPQGTINLRTQSPLTRSEAISALETVLGMNGITVVPIGEKFAKVVTELEAGKAGGAFFGQDPSALPDSGKYSTHIVQLQYVPVQDALSAIQSFAKSPASIVPIPASQTIVLRDYAENVKRMIEVLKKIDVQTPNDVKPEVIPIQYALATDIANVLGQLTASGAGTPVGRSGTTTGGRPGFGGQGGLQPGGIPGQTQIPGQPANTLGSATAGRSSFQQRLQQIVSRAASGGDFQILGQTKIIPDERTNSLLVFANDQDMIMIKDIISKMDVVLAQVLIETIILEVSLDDGRSMGVSMLQKPQTTGRLTTAGGANNGPQFLSGFTNIASSLPSGFSYFGTLGNDFDFAVNAIANDGRINVLSRPRIQTSHAVPATIEVGETVPYVTGTYGDIQGGSRSQYQQTFVGIKLQVEPLINPGGLVVMKIVQNIEQLGTPTTIDGNPVPTTTRRSAEATVSVRDRDTIMLGGFISNTKSRSKSGVPFLKDIPFFGAAFRSSNKSDRKVELMVLMRPTVLPTPESAAIAAANEKDGMPGIKQAEIEIREEEIERQKKIEEQIRRKRKSKGL